MQGKRNTKTIKGAERKQISISNAAKLDAENPLPLELGSRFNSFINGAFYIPFLAPDDSYAQLLLEARLLSTTHNACVTTKADYCGGTAFYDTTGKELDKSILDWFKIMNRKGQNVNKLNRKIFESHFTWGNTPIEIVRTTVGKKKQLFVYVHNFMEWRLMKPDSDGIVRKAVQSKLFLRTGFITADEIKNSKQLPIYSPLNTEKENWFRDEKGVERTLVWYKNDMCGFEHYGMAQAVASMIFQILEYKGARYNLDNFENNLVPAAILALKGSLSGEEATRIGKKINAQFTGDGKRGRTIVTASEEGIEGSNLHILDTKKEGSYKESDAGWTQKIILANKWDSILLGMIDASTLGKGAGFLTKIIENINRTVIVPAQQSLIEDVWQPVFDIAQAWLGLPFDQYEFGIKTAIDISGLTDVDISGAVTIDEVRESKGLPAMKDAKIGGQILGQAANKQGGSTDVQP